MSFNFGSSAAGGGSSFNFGGGPLLVNLRPRPPQRRPPRDSASAPASPNRRQAVVVVVVLVLAVHLHSSPPQLRSPGYSSSCFNWGILSWWNVELWRSCPCVCDRTRRSRNDHSSTGVRGIRVYQCCHLNRCSRNSDVGTLPADRRGEHLYFEPVIALPDKVDVGTARGGRDGPVLAPGQALPAHRPRVEGPRRGRHPRYCAIPPTCASSCDEARCCSRFL